MLILLSPSKKLNEEPLEKKVNASKLIFEKQIFPIVQEMKKYSGKDIMKLMSVSEKIADLNYRRYQNFSSEFLESNAKPALFLFKGDVYDKMDVDLYQKEDLEFAQRHLLILSGLYGLLRPLDLMQPYRLEMGTNLKVGDKKNLYDYWKEIVTSYLNEAEGRLIVNLASNEYFSAVDAKSLKAKLVNVSFKNLRDGKLKTIGLMAKRSRGMMADFIIKNKLSKLDSLKEFSVNGHVYREDLSNENNLVFVS